MIGKTVSRYRIVDKLGAGGMAEVWRAEDAKLKRPVALKLLPPQRTSDDRARQRLIHEAQAASSLDHPNICTIYEIDETEDGQIFIAMAFYEGETLKEKLGRGPLSTEEATDVVLQVGEGLAKAHRHGIVHRDVKPANLIVTPDGIVKILDFGLAKLAGTEGLTREGTLIGTAAYMSPEQMNGEEVDHRSDIWSLGVVLYQMLTGIAPFKRDTELATMHAILTADPLPLASWVAGISSEVQEVVLRALQKSREHRYQDVRELCVELRQLSGDSSAVTLLSSATWRARQAVGRPSIAVLPFADMSPEGDQEYFCDGVAEELILALARLEGLRVAARTSAFQYKGASKDVRQIGERLGVRTVLEGSVRKHGSRLRITAQLIDVANGYQLWSERFDRESDDLFALQDELAGSIVDTLRSTLVGDIAAPVVKRSTTDVEAYNLYLKGRYCWNKRTREALEKGIDYFLEALEIDPSYAQAYAGLADSYAILGIYGAMPPNEVMPPAKAAAARALELDDAMAEVYTSLGCIKALYEWTWVDAERDFRRALELDSSFPTAHQWYAINCLTPLGRFHEALSEMKRALELDPLSLVINTSLGLVYYYGRRYGQAIEEYERTLEIDPSFAIAHFFLGQAYLQRSRIDRAIESIQRAVELSGGSSEMTAALGQAYALDGRRADAERLRDELVARSAETYVSPVLVAQIEIGLERKRVALDWLERAYAARSIDLAWIEVRPVFDSLRSEPRFIALRDRVGFGELTTTRVRPESGGRRGKRR